MRRRHRRVAPDRGGEQLRTLKTHLDDPDNAHIEWVWYDYWSMLQRPPDGSDDDREPAEKKMFGWMLNNVNLLYLGGSVLLMVDLSYISRFWVRACPGERARPPRPRCVRGGRPRGCVVLLVGVRHRRNSRRG